MRKARERERPERDPRTEQKERGSEGEERDERGFYGMRIRVWRVSSRQKSGIQTACF